MKKMKQSKSDEFTKLLNPHLESAMRFCRGLCYRLSNEDAEDVLQNALVKAFRFFHQISDQDKFKPWLFTIITNSYKSYLRNRFNPFSFRIEDEENPSFPSVYQQDSELSESIRQALNSLRYKERTAILLYEVAGFSIDEIRMIQHEASASAVKSRLSRARRKLRELMRNEPVTRPSGRLTGSHKMKGDIDNETIKLVEDLQI